MGNFEKGVRSFLFFPLISDVYIVTPIPGKQYPICSREQSKLCFEALKTVLCPKTTCSAESRVILRSRINL